MKAIIKLDVPEWQIGKEVIVHFPDTMVKFEKCEPLKEQELVRCKDCKWNTGHCRGIYAQFVSCYKTGCPHKENWYCADAERKEGDGDG